MWMTDFIREIQKKFITQYGFKENETNPGLPVGVTDGRYPMNIDGNDHIILIKNDRIFIDPIE
jgi:hypothetical protein